MTTAQIRKFEISNEKCRAEEIRARNFTKQLRAKLQKEKAEGIIDDFEIREELCAFSYNKKFCKSKNIEPGDLLVDPISLCYSLHLDDDDFFNANGNEVSFLDGHPLQHLHFGYLMHCLAYHSELSFEDISKIDDVWIDVVVNYQFFTDKSEL